MNAEWVLITVWVAGAGLSMTAQRFPKAIDTLPLYSYQDYLNFQNM